jgi:hypothetical protein
MQAGMKAFKYRLGAHAASLGGRNSTSGIPVWAAKRAPKDSEGSRVPRSIWQRWEGTTPICFAKVAWLIEWPFRHLRRGCSSLVIMMGEDHTK